MLTIIIPTYNEAGGIAALLAYLQRYAGGAEIIVCDGGSTDGTAEAAVGEGIRVLRCPRRGRAAQMNYGVQQAAGTLLYFLHADTFPPKGVEALIRGALASCAAGCFRLRFDAGHPLLRFHAWFTRFPFTPFRFGDQSLFCTRAAFTAAGGFRDDFILLEDQEIIPRLKRQGRFRVLPQAVRTSARKYRTHGVCYTQSAFYLIYFLYAAGWPQHRLAKLYRRLFRGEKT